MSFKAFLHEIQKGLPLPLYLFHTSEPFLYREAIEAIKRLVPDSEKDFNLHIFDFLYPGEASFEQVLDAVNTFPFFGKRRFVVFSGNLQKLPKKDMKKLNAYISNPSSGSVFVILHDGVLKKDMREMMKELKPISLDIRESEIPYWMRQRALMKGFEISDEAADCLIGLVGTDLGLLSSEIEKISLLDKKRIGMDDIADIIVGGRLYSIFDLVDALREKNIEKVFRTYRILIETTDDYSLIGALNWQYGRNMPTRNRPAENEYYSMIFEVLNKADIEIKSSGRTFPMEYLLIKLLRLRKGRSPSW
jgi:DNA polymerase-3 subunit delta